MRLHLYTAVAAAASAATLLVFAAGPLAAQSSAVRYSGELMQGCSDMRGRIVQVTVTGDKVSGFLRTENNRPREFTATIVDGRFSAEAGERVQISAEMKPDESIALRLNTPNCRYTAVLSRLPEPQSPPAPAR